MAKLFLAALAPLAVIPALGRPEDVATVLARVRSEASAALPSADPHAPYRQPLINYGDSQYVTFLTLGRQLVTGMIDTGSSELVVFGASCTTCGRAAHYNSQLSSTYAEGRLQTQHFFGSGKATSISGKEELLIGPFFSKNQTFWAAQNADMPILENAAFEAVIGLGPPEHPMVSAWEVAVEKVQELTDTYDRGELAPRPIIESARSAINIAKSVTSGAPMLRAFKCSSFSICLGAKPGSNGILIWNDNAAKEKSHLFSKVPVTGNATWSVKLSEPVMAGPRGSATFSCGDGPCTALLDTGSSILAVPRAVKEKLVEAMVDLKPDCSNLDVMPSLHFRLGEATVSLAPDTYIAKVDFSRSQIAHTIFQRVADPANHTGHSCSLMVTETDDLKEEGDKNPLWVLGVPFFRKYYTSFELGQSTNGRAVHLAAHSDDCDLEQAQTSLLLRGMEAATLTAAHIRLPKKSSLGAVPSEVA